MSSNESTASSRLSEDRAQKPRRVAGGSSADGTLADVSALIRSGEWQVAEDVCTRLAQASPQDPRVLHRLGEIAYRSGDFPKAVAVLKRVVALDPEKVAYHAHLGMTLARAGRHEDAVAALNKAVAMKPGAAEAWFNLGDSLRVLRRMDKAMAAFRRAIDIKPQFFAAYDGLAVTLKDAGQIDKAVEALRRALEIRPGAAEGWDRLGEFLKLQGQFGEAASAYVRATEIAPDFARAHRSLGLVLMRQRKYEQAMHVLRRAIDLDPNDVQARCHLANACVGQSRTAEAVREYARALELAPDSAAARIGLCMAQLPIIYDDEASVDASRAAYRRQLAALHAHFANKPGPVLAEAANAVGLSQPFFLAYQGRVDRDVQALYGEVVCEMMAAAYPQWGAPLPMPEPDGEGRIRVGIVSGFFHWHSNWKIPIKGWAEQLDRRRFKLFAYYTQTRQDTATKRAVETFERFTQGPQSFSRWCEAIRQDDPHVLIFPEIGMDPMTAKLAALRLAPVQCSSWGHPNTSGYPTIDYFLSSDLMEPPDGADHYTETLVRLPNLSVHYTPPPVAAAAMTRADLGVRDGAVVYWCCQSLFKYLPRHDDIFPRIASEVGDCQFVFIRHGSDWVTETFRARLERVFAAHGLSWAKYCVFSDKLDPGRFAGAMSVVDIFLDSVGWSGCNTTLESFAAGLPAVTCRGETMRARHTAAMMEMIGLSECVADTVDDYVTLAARMGTDAGWRSGVAGKVVARRHRAYDDRACIEGLEAFLLRAVEKRALL